MKILLTTGLIFSTFLSIGQNAFYDAQSISKLDTTDLQNILKYGQVYFLDAYNNFVPPENVSWTDKMDPKNPFTITTNDVVYKKENGLYYAEYPNLDKKTIVKVSLFALKFGGKLYNKYKLVDITSTIDVSFGVAYILSEEEIVQIQNLISFIRNPFDSTLTRIDLNIINGTIDKYNSNAEELNLPKQPRMGFIGGAVSVASIGLISSLLNGGPSINEEDQTKIIDGLVKYIAEEFKRAQMISYMNVFERTIAKIGEFQVLFPKTYAKLERTDPIKFPDLGDEFKEIFSQDFKALMDNFVEHIELHTFCSPLEKKLTLLNASNVKKIKESKEYKSFKLANDISSKLIHNYHPVDLFNYLDQKYYNASMSLSDNEIENKIGFYLHGINILQSNMLDTLKAVNNQFSNVWLNYQQLSNLNTTIKKKYFLALIYQQDRVYFNKLLFGNSKVNKTLIEKKLKDKMDSIIPTLIELQKFRANLNEENLKDNFEDYMRLVIEIVEGITNKSDGLQSFFEVADDVIDIYENIRAKDYGNTIFHMNEILREFISEFDANDNFLNTLEKIDHYGSFMAAVVRTENSDEMKDVIRTFVAPAASYVFKRQYNWTLSITSHPGYFVGFERNKVNQNTNIISGLTLPIGFDLNYKLIRNKRENSATLGLSGQLLDLGAVLNFRIADSVSTLPDFANFKQLFSPGFSVNFGFANSPLTIGAGYVYTPELRKITLANGNELFPHYHRFSVRLSWDLPLIFLGKSKKYSKYDKFK